MQTVGRLTVYQANPGHDGKVNLEPELGFRSGVELLSIAIPIPRLSMKKPLVDGCSREGRVS